MSIKRTSESIQGRHREEAAGEGESTDSGARHTQVVNPHPPSPPLVTGALLSSSVSLR